MIPYKTVCTVVWGSLFICLFLTLILACFDRTEALIPLGALGISIGNAVVLAQFKGELK